MADYDPRRPLVQPHAPFSYYTLFITETEYMAKADRFIVPGELEARQKALALIESYSQSENFDAFVPYIAMNYYDRYASNCEMPVFVEQFDFRLSVICCLTLAWKTRIKSFNDEKLLMKLEVKPELVPKMEDRIQNNLNRRMRSVTPICFVHYFIAYLNTQNQILKPRRVYEIIIRSPSKVVFTKCRPSVVAASAVLTALSVECPHQFRDCADRMSIFLFLDWDTLVLCFRVMLDWHNKKFGAGRTRTVLDGFDNIIQDIQIKIHTRKYHQLETSSSSSLAPTSDEAEFVAALMSGGLDASPTEIDPGAASKTQQAMHREAAIQAQKAVVAEVEEEGVINLPLLWVDS